ncbi:hypothetical protein D3C74_309240 [compost metagenome]
MFHLGNDGRVIVRGCVLLPIPVFSRSRQDLCLRFRWLLARRVSGYIMIARVGSVSWFDLDSFQRQHHLVGKLIR